VIRAVTTSACSSYSEETFHRLMDKANEDTKECSVYTEAVACNKAINAMNRLNDYMSENKDKVTAHLKVHPFDMEQIERMTKPLEKR